MILTCYYCNKDLPSNQIKRCSRCLLVTYCSKECQTMSWKASHKLNCKIHPSIVSKPLVKLTPEWFDLEADKALSRWLQIWRSSFQTWTKIALDLPNHPAERVMTHCMQLVIQPRNFQDDPAKQYHIIQASVVAISDVQADHPNLEIFIDPTDFTRLRFVVLLQNCEGELRRLRLFQWNDLNVDKWRKISEANSTALVESEQGWAQTLMYAVNSMDPKEIEEMFGKKRL